jgi:hypothetical protein
MKTSLQHSVCRHRSMSKLLPWHHRTLIAPRLSLQTTYSSTSFTHKLANKNVENTHASLRHLLPAQRSAPTRTASTRRNSLCLDLRDDFELPLAVLTRHEPSVFGPGPGENLEQRWASALCAEDTRARRYEPTYAPSTIMLASCIIKR